VLAVLKEKKRRKRENQDTRGEKLGLQKVLRTGILTLGKTCICVYRIHLLRILGGAMGSRRGSVLGRVIIGKHSPRLRSVPRDEIGNIY